MRFACAFAAATSLLCAAVHLPDGVSFREGDGNLVLIRRTTAVYGIPQGSNQVKRVLLTHARRDLLSGLSGSVAGKIDIIAPAAERSFLENPGSFWAAIEKTRFHDYAQQSTKMPVDPLRVALAVSPGDTVAADGVQIRVVPTPGYTVGAVSYLFETGGKRVACTGDLIYGDGRIFDLYSLQDAVPEAKARGYHGYAARAGALIESLERIRAAKPDIILPARGPAITDPAQAIDRLIRRLRTFLRSHYETDALRWYWGDENHKVRSRAAGNLPNVLPMAEQAELPPDIVAIGNSRLIVSRTGAAFLVDSGYRNLQGELNRLRSQKRITGVEGMWITHYHDDHTDFINDVASDFGTPVYFTDRMAEILAGPAGFRLPCLPAQAISRPSPKRDGETLRWHEWLFTFLYFPGQTMYHGGLVAQRDGGQTYLFTGDSFTPSGMDDYCMQNRNFLAQNRGYDYCLRKISELPSDTWLINQHVAPLFRYTSDAISRMQQELDMRSKALAELSPWPNINYMTDESWARIHPWSSGISEGKTAEYELRILNHAPTAMQYEVKWNLPSGWTAVKSRGSVRLRPGEEGKVRVSVRPSGSGLQVLTADISFNGRTLRQWTEALVRVR